MILTIIAVLFFFSLLVVAHEFGHFIVARRNGVHVDEFGIGFPPKLWGIKRGKTLFSLNALPIGGFVRLKGEVGESKANDSFAAQRTWPKAKILMAGVGMNLLVAYVIITALLVVGIPPLTSKNLPSLGPIHAQTGSTRLLVVDVADGSLAQQTGYALGDRIISVDGVTQKASEQLRNTLIAKKGRQVAVVRTHDHKELTDKLQLPSTTQPNVGLLGVVTAPETLQRYPWWAAPIMGFVVLGQLVLGTIGVFVNLVGSLFSKAKVTDGVAGPVGITFIFADTFKLGAQYIAVLIASISVSLAVVNSLPLVPFDGGRLAFILLRRAGLKLTEGLEVIATLVGYVALIVLFVFVTSSDIAHFLPNLHF